MGGEDGEQHSSRASAAGAKADLNPAAERASEERTSRGKRPLWVSACGGADSRGEQGSAAEPRCTRASRPGQARGERQESSGLERGTASREEQVPEDETPGALPGRNKPGPELRGVNRRGREKRRGRKVAGSGKPAVTGSAIPHTL